MIAGTLKPRSPSYVVGVDLYRFSDGTPVEIRPIAAADATRLREAHLRLSPESRYRRFLAAKPELNEADAHYLVDIDGSDHYALVATAAVQDDPNAIIAVARFVRAPDDPTAAEFAIVVGDAFQRQGLGGALLERLAAAASRRGVKRFLATMMSDNVAIFRLMAELSDGELQVVNKGEISEAEIELPQAPMPPGVRATDTRAKIAACPGS